jgi:hypothetical protein
MKEIAGSDHLVWKMKESAGSDRLVWKMKKVQAVTVLSGE